MRLRVIKGPLSEKELLAVARLYGGFRPKYAELSFVRHLFNDNPHGYSFHAFLDLDSGEPVGHYAIVPMNVLVDGVVKLSGKAEALIVLPEHRRDTVPLDDGTPALCGLVMPSRLYRFALQQGADLVHMIPSPDVQAIYPATGARAVPGSHQRERLMIHPLGAVNPRATGFRRTIQWASALAQRTAFAGARAVRLAGAPRPLRWDGNALTPELLERVSKFIPASPGWTLAVDGAHLAWLARTAPLEVIALDDRFDNFAIVTSHAGEGRVLEVLAWRQRTGGTGAALRLLDAVVQSGVAAGDHVVGVSHTSAWSEDERVRLHFAARVLCFQERTQRSDLFVSTRNKEYLDPTRLRFSPFFYAIY